jgi:hypothetical protein
VDSPVPQQIFGMVAVHPLPRPHEQIATTFNHTEARDKIESDELVCGFTPSKNN